jgi:hypothetical protein
MASNNQEALLIVLAAGTKCTIDPSKTPKANFACLAQAKGWVGGDANWCARWNDCFGEDYPYGAKSKSDWGAEWRRGCGMRGTSREMLTSGSDSERPKAPMRKGEEKAAEKKAAEKKAAEKKAAEKKAAEKKAAEKKAAEEKTVEERAAKDLEESMRRLSVGSDESDFSLVSRTSRADSFGSVRSLDSLQSGNSVIFTKPRSRKDSTDSWNSQDPGNSVLSLDTVKSLDSIVGGVNISEASKSVDTDTDTDTASQEDDEDEEVECNLAWYDYGNFVPEPSASFKTEFERLARYKGWAGETKRYHLIDLLGAEVEFHFGDGEEKLCDFQDLCEDLGIENIPSTLTQCRKVSQNNTKHQGLDTID